MKRWRRLLGPDLVAEIEREIAAAKESGYRAGHADACRAIMRAASGAGTAQEHPARRRPSRYAEDAIEIIGSAEDGLALREIVAALKARGIELNYDAAKTTFARLVAAGRLCRVGTTWRSRYYVPRHRPAAATDGRRVA